MLRQYLDRIKPPRRGKFTWAAVLPAPSSIVLNHHVPLKFVAQLTLQPGCAFPLPKHLPTARLQHRSTSTLLSGQSVCHTACPRSSVLWRASSHSSPPSSCEGQCWNGKLGFLHLSCFSLPVILYYIYILYRGLKRAGRKPHTAKPGGMPHTAGPQLSAAALHAWGCALRKAGLKSERTEAENNMALALSALNSQENPRQNSAWGDQQFHGTSDACKSWHD